MYFLRGHIPQHRGGEGYWGANPAGCPQIPLSHSRMGRGGCKVGPPHTHSIPTSPPRAVGGSPTRGGSAASMAPSNKAPSVLSPGHRPSPKPPPRETGGPPHITTSPPTPLVDPSSNRGFPAPRHKPTPLPPGGEPRGVTPPHPAPQLGVTPQGHPHTQLPSLPGGYFGSVIFRVAGATRHPLNLAKAGEGNGVWGRGVHPKKKGCAPMCAPTRGEGGSGVRGGTA